MVNRLIFQVRVLFHGFWRHMIVMASTCSPDVAFDILARVKVELRDFDGAQEIFDYGLPGIWPISRGRTILSLSHWTDVCPATVLAGGGRRVDGGLCYAGSLAPRLWQVPL